MKRILLLIGFYSLTLFLPSRVFAATYTVTKTADTNDGTCNADCSFREAVAAANANSGADSIAFNIPTSDGNWNTSSYPNAFRLHITVARIVISDAVSIDGDTQTSFTGDSNVAVAEPNAMPVTGTASRGPEIIFTSGLGSTALIEISGADVTVNRIGVYDLSVTQRRAIQIDGTASRFTVSNSDFVHNLQGVINVSGTPDRTRIVDNVFRDNESTGRDVIEDKFTNVTIDGNQFVGNGNHAIAMWSAVVQVGTSVISNNLFKYNGFSTTENPSAIVMNTNEPFTVRDNVFVGNTEPYAFSLDATSRVTYRNNTMYDGDSAHIDLSGGTENADTVTANDAGDTDSGPNQLMNYPVIDHADWLGGGRYRIGGTFDGNAAEAPFTIEVCQSDGNVTGHGGCSMSLGTVITSSAGWELSVTVPGDTEVQLSQFSALATNTNGSTSEFSANYRGRLPGGGTGTQPVLSQVRQVTGSSGGVIAEPFVVAVVDPDSFMVEAKMTVKTDGETATYNLPGTLYWQASPIHEVVWKSPADGSVIPERMVFKPYIIALRYEDGAINPLLPERNLRLAYSDDLTTWNVIADSVPDTVNNTVAAISRRSGHYMLVSGYTDAPVVTGTVQSFQTEVAELPIPEPVPVTAETGNKPEPPIENRRCFWIFCF